MTSEKVQFAGAHGGKLAAVLEKPGEAAPRGYALFAHCFTCTKDIFSARYITAGLAAHGFAVLRFDFTGQGASEGEFANTNFSSNVQDLICAADYLRTAHAAPTLIVGHSLGGAAVLAAAGDIPEIRAVATIGAPAEPAHVRHLFTDAYAKIEEEGEAEVLLAGRPFRIKKQFLEDIESTRLAGRIATMNKALLVMHSVVDKTVDIENARKIYEAAKHPKSFVSLDRADHLLSDRRDAVYASGVLAAWAERYLPSATDQPLPEADEQTVVVSESGNNGLAQKIYNGRHELVADEPTALGGTGTGPTPYGYLLAALGACTTMTLRLYARRKKIPLTRATVTLRHQKTHAADCETCESGAGKIDSIRRTLKLEGDLTGQQRATLLAIAEKCPVHKTLTAPTTITTELE